MRELIDHLETLMSDLMEENEALLTVLDQKLEAMRVMDTDALNSYTLLENERLQRIGDLEKERQMQVAKITELQNPKATDLLNLFEISKLCEPAQAKRLIKARADLKQVLSKLRFKSKVVQRASEGILNNVRGVMHSLGQALSSGGTYGRRGNMNAGTGTLATTFNATG